MKRNIAAVSIAFVLACAAPTIAADGPAVFTAQKCQLCHSIAGKGSAKNPLDGIGKKLSAADIKKWIVSPKEMKADTKMKAYANLPAADLDALVAYISSLK